jgi:hypothetical protein
MSTDLKGSAPAPGARSGRARVPAWAAALAAGVLAAGLTGAAGEAAVGYFDPLAYGTPGTAGVVTGGSERAMIRDAALAYGLQGAILGLLLGLAGVVAGGRARARAALLAIPAGLLVGGLGAAASLGLFQLGLRHQDPIAGDLTLSLLTHSGVWAAVGAGGGLAFGLGMGLRPPARLVHAAFGGLAGGALGAVIYEVVGSLAFPIAQTGHPYASEAAPRFLAHAAVDILAALGAGLVAGRRGS